MKQLLSFRNAVKRSFRMFGLEVSKIRGRRITMAQALYHILDRGFIPRTVIDVGVAYGTPDLYIFKDAKYILIEPLEEFDPYINRILNAYDAEHIRATVGPHTGHITINVKPDIEGSSVFNEKAGKTADGLQRRVPVVTLDEIYADRKLIGPFLIKIDAEGAELQVLDGAHNLLKNTKVVILEVSLLSNLKDAPEFAQVIEYMKTAKFVPYDIFGGRYRSEDKALAQVDIVFVKESGLFGESDGI